MTILIYILILMNDMYKCICNDSKSDTLREWDSRGHL